MKSSPIVFKLSWSLYFLFLLSGTHFCQAQEERYSLDPAWRFYQGDIPFPVIKGHGASYTNAKAGKAWGAAAPDFDDSEWRMVDLPHDWAVEGPFDKEANLSQGYRNRGIGWYRRNFRLDPADRGKSLELQFDGIATHCKVWVNGTVLHRNWCGYTSFYIDLTPMATYGDELNNIVIRVDADDMEGWWYEGAGIYRHTWLVKRPPVHFVTDGVFTNPIRSESGKWSIPLEATLFNDGKTTALVEVSSEVIDPKGAVVAKASGKAEVIPLNETTAKFSIPVESPVLWSLENPAMYRVKTTITQDGVQGETRTTNCGFRTIRFDADKGFFLNDKPVKIKGTCNHMDHAGVGVAVPDSLWEFRIRKLKEMGSNAYRCSHNPPPNEFLEACDRMGMLVMDENRNFNVSPEYVRQLEWLVRRDRNHPSVILWSVFNEETMQGTEAGYEMVRRMVAVVKRLDTSRPVTAAMSGGHNAPINVSQAVDVVGFNYNQGVYEGFHNKHPGQPITSSEDTSAFMTRGMYEADKKNQISDCYDTQRAGWGATHHEAWKAINEKPYVAGGFVWTGFDYRGEPTPYSWPAAGSVFGIMDLCGFPKSAFYWHQAMWIEDRPILKLIPHWNWKGKEGQPIKVMALTNADTVSLILNGTPLEEKPVVKYDMVEWQVPYAPGTLEAIAKKGGKEVARDKVETTGEATSLKVIPDRTSLSGDGADAVTVTIMGVDDKGREMPTANNPITFELSGPGEIIGLGNGDSNSHEPEKGNQRSLFNGLAQVILRSKKSGSGALTLKATSPGLSSATGTVEVTAASAMPSVPETPYIFALSKWKMSPCFAEKPDPNLKTSDNDMNSWQNVSTGNTQDFKEGVWAIYRITLSPVGSIQKNGGKLLFNQITGAAEISVDGVVIGEKKSIEPSSLTINLPPGKNKQVLSVLFHVSKAGDKGGFSGSVILQ